MIEFRAPEIAAALLLGIVVSLLLYALFGRRKRYRAHSGHFIPGEFKESVWAKIWLIVSRTALILSFAMAALALADPFYLGSYRAERIKSRARVDLIDLSMSMCFEYENQEIPLGRVAREEYLKFLELRHGKNDLVSLWVFSLRPYRIQRFTRDNYLLMFRAVSTPLAFSREDNLVFGSPYDRCEKDDIQILEEEGGTDLGAALDAILDYVEDEGKSGLKEKAALIITDAAVYPYPSDQLKRLQNAGIRPYVLLIRPNLEALRYYNQYQQIVSYYMMLNDLEKYGGRYFVIGDRRDLREAFTVIDRLEPTVEETRVFIDELNLYDRFVFLALILALLGSILGFVYELRWGSII